MKKVFLFVFLAFVSMTFAQKTQETYTKQGKIVAYNVPITLAKTGTNYSNPFSLDGYMPADSSHFIPVLWQSNDTVQVTVALQVRSTITTSLGATYKGSWQTAVTLTSVQANAGNDTLYVMNVVQRGTIAPAVTDMATMAGKIGNEARLVVTFANPTTVGNSGQFRVWAYLTKQ